MKKETIQTILRWIVTVLTAILGGLGGSAVFNG